MRNRVVSATWIAALVMLVAAVSIRQAAAETPAAVLMSCRGNVTVARANGESVAATFGLQLHSGDRIKTGADSAAEVMLEEGSWLQIGANSGMQIKGRPATQPTTSKPASERSFEVVQNFLKLKDAEGTSALTGLRGGDAPQIAGISPGHTRIRDAHPTFRWEVADPNTELRLTVYGERGVHWQTDVTGVSAEYAADGPALLPGTRYSWTVETTDPLVFPPLRSAAAYFEVISPEKAETLDKALSAIESGDKPSPSTYHLMRASVFFDWGLLEDAIEETRAALSSEPNQGALHAILARLYSESGRTSAALAEYERLMKQP